MKWLKLDVVGKSSCIECLYFLSDDGRYGIDDDPLAIFTVKGTPKFYFTEEFCPGFRLGTIKKLEVAFKNGERFIEFDTLEEAKTYYLMLS